MIGGGEVSSYDFFFSFFFGELRPPNERSPSGCNIQQRCCQLKSFSIFLFVISDDQTDS